MFSTRRPQLALSLKEPSTLISVEDDISNGNLQPTVAHFNRYDRFCRSVNANTRTTWLYCDLYIRLHLTAICKCSACKYYYCMCVVESTRAVFSLFAVVEVSTFNSESIENLCYLPTLPGRVKFQKGVSGVGNGVSWICFLAFSPVVKPARNRLQKPLLLRAPLKVTVLSGLHQSVTPCAPRPPTHLYPVCDHFHFRFSPIRLQLICFSL